MQINGFSLGPLGTNCYIVYHGNQAIIIDPGEEANRIMEWLTENKLVPLAILLTHAHFDHIGAVEDLRNHFAIPVYVHPNEASWLSKPSLNGSVLFLRKEVKTREAEVLINPGLLQIGPFEFEILYTPGHSPGSVSFYWKEEKKLISGDVLFNQGIGRTDLPGGDFDVLKESILYKLYQLPDDITVYPGHGPSTTIGDEKSLNPFIRPV
ncbi:MBL fold metallo-hydrolase [Ornithinibacillus bavariensis]|uniref:Hydroxyacylglutathione hydrolase n=1 Tax=Ornithinibacillus bavariensis TaxID=545502 RepID=A0A919XBA2_9BACI|nr:MBL fold metallo-hydrolase [Ornithinibacillus bavariensis]GIO27515.1 hydroxyacylglutathione hydrolase [Ornithinibacillus bavariensis]